MIAPIYIYFQNTTRTKLYKKPCYLMVKLQLHTLDPFLKAPFSPVIHPTFRLIVYYPYFTHFQHLVLALYQQNRQHGSNYNEIQYWIPLFLPLGSSKLDTDIPLFFSKIQYLLLLIIIRVVYMQTKTKQNKDK